MHMGQYAYRSDDENKYYKASSPPELDVFSATMGVTAKIGLFLSLFSVAALARRDDPRRCVIG